MFYGTRHQIIEGLTQITWFLLVLRFDTMHQGVSDSINIGRGNPSSGGEVGNSIGDNFLLGVGNLIKNDFDLSHLYQS